jgi:Fe-S cluster biogenesis protein NfuA
MRTGTDSPSSPCVAPEGQKRLGRAAILEGLSEGSPILEERVMTTGTADPEMEAGVLQAIEAIRPALQADGGDIVFKRIDDDGVVYVDLVGACGSCPVSTMTLKAGVERIIMDRVPGVTAVEEDI